MDPKDRTSTGGRVLIVSASMGAGHESVARELARRLQRDGHQTEVVDFLDAFPWRLGQGLRRMYQLQLQYAPWSYEATYKMWMRATPLVAFVTFPMTWLTRRRLLEWIERFQADAVVATYVVAPLVLGRARRLRLLAVPAAVVVTDFAVHQLWTHPGMDLTVCVSPASAQLARRYTRHTAAFGPLVADRFFAAPDRASARAALGLPAQGALALMVSGAWGAGDVADSVAEVAATGRVTPIVVCGNNKELYERLVGRPGMHVYGWTDQMPALMAACDVVIENAGGQSCMEAFAVGRPVVTYRPIPGHGKHNASVMAQVGVNQVAHGPAELDAALARALGEPGQASAAAARRLFDGDAAGAIGALVRPGGASVAPAERSA
ncbi:MAG TPA: glycosyltransferase [Sporichthyaceae bacterium]|nr:glycosyltransferase [Sporichthyaceae bacterium]